jgi:hypothetical protein
MTHLIKSLIILMVSGTALFGQGKFSLETDPSTFAFGGYAAHLRWQPSADSHWQFGAGAYAMDFPDLFVDINPDNADEGWDVRLDSGIGLFGEYYLKPGGKGWLLGAQLAIQRYSVENSELSANETAFSNLLLMPYAGYRWYPTDSGLYLQPWAGLGVTGKISGSNDLGGDTYDVSPIIPFMTLHVGYTF